MNNFITINKVLIISVVLAISLLLLVGPTSTIMDTFTTPNTLIKAQVNPRLLNKMFYVYLARDLLFLVIIRMHKVKVNKTVTLMY